MATSYLQNDYSRELFLKRRKAVMTQLLNICLAVFFIIFDGRYHNNPLRQCLGNMTSAFYFVVHKPLETVRSVYDFFHLQQKLHEQNNQLKIENMRLQTQLQKSHANVYHHELITGWLKASDEALQLAVIANILSIEVNANRHIYVLDKGTKDGVFEGQVAIDGHAALGQIIDVGYYTSTLLLVSDSKCAVPIINKANGEHGIVVGENKLDKLYLLNVPKTNTVKAGDLLMTSGLGQVYPFGIPVGRVSLVNTVPGEEFMHVEVSPIAALNKHHSVILLKSFKDIQKWQNQLKEREKILEENI